MAANHRLLGFLVVGLLTSGLAACQAGGPGAIHGLSPDGGPASPGLVQENISAAQKGDEEGAEGTTGAGVSTRGEIGPKADNESVITKPDEPPVDPRHQFMGDGDQNGGPVSGPTPTPAPVPSKDSFVRNPGTWQ